MNLVLTDPIDSGLSGEGCWIPNIDFSEPYAEFEIFGRTARSMYRYEDDRAAKDAKAVMRVLYLAGRKAEAPGAGFTALGRGRSGRYGLQLHPTKTRRVTPAWATKAKVHRRVIISATPAVPHKLVFSPTTLELVRRGFRLHAAATPEGLIEEGINTREISTEDLSNFIREQFYLMIGGIVDVLVQYRKARFLLAFEGSFTNALDYLLQSRLPNVPKEFGDLSRSLCRDLLNHLHDGGRIEGSWGQLLLQGNALILAAEGRPVMPPAPVGRARVIE